MALNRFDIGIRARFGGCAPLLGRRRALARLACKRFHFAHRQTFGNRFLRKIGGFIAADQGTRMAHSERAFGEKGKHGVG